MKGLLMLLIRAMLVWGILAGFYPLIYWFDHRALTYIQLAEQFWLLGIGSWICGVLYGVLA
jgi:hypothetical protein